MNVNFKSYKFVVKNLNFILFVFAWICISKGLLTNKDLKNFLDFFNEEYSTFYEENYISVSKDDLKIENKKNLIFIIVESLEQTFSDSEVYGKNLIPNLSKLDGIKFSNFENGYATDYTAGMIIGSFTGLPPYLSLRDLNYYGHLQTPYPAILSLGRMLKNNGYYTSYILGSKVEFAGTNEFLSTHGIDEMIDRGDIEKEFPNLKIAGKWGYGDSDVFSVAQSKLIESVADGKKIFL